MNEHYYLCMAILALAMSAHEKLNEKKFPDNFLFGTATASYQIEGAWNLTGKGENIWDRYTHAHPEYIRDRSNGDIACDSYHKFREDIALMKQMGVNFYRFSLSWSRILPKGLAYNVNPDGIRYYNDLINLLVENDIIPMVTMFHWDTPQPIEDLGGFSNDLFVEWFQDYARVAIENFGDRVKYWITFNEPKQTCLEGVGMDNKAPGYNSSGIGDYLCSHNLIKAHARVYHMYNDEYKKKQGGLMSITIDTSWWEPASDSQEDTEAAERKMLFTYGWYADPIYHPNGDYPQVMKKLVAERSKKEGFKHSRLPEFTQEEIEYIKGTYDFMGLNHYTTYLTKNAQDEPIGDPSVDKDCRVKTWQDSSWPSTASSWFKVVPWGFTKVLNWIANRYGNIDIYITENGYADYGEKEDIGRINYYKEYLSAVLDAMYGKFNVSVKAYAAWSLLDNFEWKDGYYSRYGMIHVDFNDPTRKRTPKASVKYYKDVIANKTVLV